MKTYKTKYTAPELEIIAMENQGVIAASLDGVPDEGEFAGNLLKNSSPAPDGIGSQGLDAFEGTLKG